MIEKWFFEKFELIADAPNAVARMRELVLELAVQGRIVPQDSRDASAAEEFSELEIGAFELDPRFDIPANWIWAPLEPLLLMMKNGFNGKPNKLGGHYKVTRIETIASGKIDMSRVGFADDLQAEVVGKHLIQNGDILFSHINSEPHLGKTAICTFDDPTLIHGVNLLLLRSKPQINPHYLNTVFKELRVSGYFVSIAQRAINQSSINQKNLGKTLIPLPPLAEQKRIVAKVDELMALCDQLEAQQQERETRKSTLARASLARFATAPTPTNLEFLFHKSYDITPADFRKSILTLAVQGKLVPQNPNDEPAETLCQPDEELAAASSFEVPNGWIWTRLLKLAEINGGFAFKSTAYTEEGTRVVRISDFDEFGFKDHKVVRYPFSADLQKYALEEQNILMAMTGGTVGKSYFVRSMPEPMVVNQRVATIKVSDSALPSYIDIVIRSEMTQEVIRKAKNSTNDNISMGDIKGFTIPLPPLAEQHRIVAKVEQVMTLVDELESQLDSTRVTGSKLLEAIVDQLTNGGANHAIEV